MELSKHLRDGVTVIELDGELDSSTAARAQGGLDELLPECGGVLLDLSRMSYMSSAGLRVLLLVYRQARRTGVDLALTGLPPDIRATMSATGFLAFFTIVATVDEGVEVLSR
jgi:anti-anti-sigma factor